MPNLRRVSLEDELEGVGVAAADVQRYYRYFSPGTSGTAPRKRSHLLLLSHPALTSFSARMLFCYENDDESGGVASLAADLNRSCLHRGSGRH